MLHSHIVASATIRTHLVSAGIELTPEVETLTGKTRTYHRLHPSNLRTRTSNRLQHNSACDRDTRRTRKQTPNNGASVLASRYDLGGVGGVVKDAIHVVGLRKPHPHVVEVATCKRRDGGVAGISSAGVGAVDGIYG